MPSSKLVDQSQVSTFRFDWGTIKFLVAPANTEGAQMSFGQVVLMPGKGHDRHNHPGSEEILHVLAGRGMQMVDDGEPFEVRAGDTIYIPDSGFHSTINTSWEPMVLLAIYNPAGPEEVLRQLPDFGELPPGQAPTLTVG